MFRTILLFTLLVFLAGCKTYQKYDIMQDRKGEKNEALLFTQDSVKLEVIFSKKDLVFDLKVSNHKKSPITIDWNKTMLVVDEKVIPIKNQKQRIVLRGTYENDLNHYQVIDMEGAMFESEKVNFLPPQSSMAIRIDHLENTIQFNENKNEGKEVFTSNDSPFQFRIYLTYIDDITPHEYAHVDMPLYVSCRTHLKKYPGDQLLNNEFFLKKGNRSGGVVFGGAALIIVVFSILSFT